MSFENKYPVTRVSFHPVPVCSDSPSWPLAMAGQPLLGQQGQGDAARQQSLAKGILGDGRPEPVAAFCQGLKRTGRGVHAVVTSVLGEITDQVR